LNNQYVRSLTLRCGLATLAPDPVFYALHKGISDRLTQVHLLCAVKRSQSSDAVFRRGPAVLVHAHQAVCPIQRGSHAAAGKTFPLAELRGCRERKRESRTPENVPATFQFPA